MNTVSLIQEIEKLPVCFCGAAPQCVERVHKDLVIATIRQHKSISHYNQYGKLPSKGEQPQDVQNLLRDMRVEVEYTDVVTMPIPLYERMKAAIAAMGNVFNNSSKPLNIEHIAALRCAGNFITDLLPSLSGNNAQQAKETLEVVRGAMGDKNV